MEQVWNNYEVETLQKLKKGWYLLMHGWDADEGAQKSAVEFNGKNFNFTENLGCIFSVFDKCFETEDEAINFIDAEV